MCLQVESRVQRAKRPEMPPPDLMSPHTPEKDAGFCSGEDDDSEESNRSNSDDSGLKMGLENPTPSRNKRKIGDTLRVLRHETFTAPPKKRLRHEDPETWGGQRVPPHPAVLGAFSVDALLEPPHQPPSLPPPPPPAPQNTPREQRNYKNMTRERRIEANARERTRVHTISAAFDTLRHCIPAYSHNQKLSKLSVLRIACSYIMTLSKIVQEDANEESSDVEDEPCVTPDIGVGDMSLSDCIESVSKTIQTEGKLRKRRDDV